MWEPNRIQEIQLGKERGDGCQTAIDGEAREPSSVLIFHEAQTALAINPFQRQAKRRKEDFQVMGIIDPGMDGLTHFDFSEKMVDERRVGRHSDHGALLIFESNLDRLVNHQGERCHIYLHIYTVLLEYTRPLRGRQYSPYKY